MNPTLFGEDAVLVTDHSSWDVLLRPQELIDGGVTDVILKGGSGVRTDSRFLKNGEDVAKFSQYLRMHIYWWDDPIYSAVRQIDYSLGVVEKSGFPIRSYWVDQEQWWADWDEWYAAITGKKSWGSVRVFSKWALNVHNETFAANLAKATALPMGIYTGRGFVTTYAPAMSAWLGKHKILLAAYGKQPIKGTKMTWQTFKDNWLPDYDPIYRDLGITSDNIVGHQFTGDSCCLPGAYQDVFGIKRSAMDVSRFRQGYMETLGQIVDDIPPVAPTPVPQTEQYIFTGSHLWVRQSPSADSKLIDSITHDQRVVVIERNGKWARIESPAGWVDSGWLTKL
jgi:uncharacterized protein YgiM (DUF1202 family)